MTSCTGSALRILGDFEKVRLELSPASEEDGWLSLARGGLGQVSHEMGGGRWKWQNTKIVPLSPYVEKPLNSKVIKSFVPELRSRKCFSCFEIPMFYVIYLWTLYVHFTHNWMQAKRDINTWTLLWTWKWWWYQLQLARTVQSAKDWYRN